MTEVEDSTSGFLSFDVVPVVGAEWAYRDAEACSDASFLTADLRSATSMWKLYAKMQECGRFFDFFAKNRPHSK